VLRFHVETTFVARYEPQVVGSAVHRELWVPSEDLEALNDHIVGTIEVIAEFRSPAG
jgi:hypothetical protein